MVLEEPTLPMPREVSAACEMLGLDPLYVANEGIFVAIVPEELAEAALAALQGAPAGPGRATHRTRAWPSIRAWS